MIFNVIVCTHILYKRILYIHIYYKNVAVHIYTEYPTSCTPRIRYVAIAGD